MSDRIKKIHASTQGAAAAYYEMGWFPVPIPRGKAPKTKGWTKTKYDSLDELRTAFPGGVQNVGIILGPSRLLDIDLDWQISPLFAPYFLPPTGAIFGREGKKSSHWVYSGDSSGKVIKIRPPFPSDDKEVIAELRCGDGHQTVFPPSTWLGEVRSEAIRWDKGCDPTKASYETLEIAVRRIGAACYLSTVWKEGSRNDLALSLTGCLIELGWKDGLIVNFISALAEVSGDEQASSRIKIVAATREKVESFEPVTGLPRLCELITGQDKEGDDHKILRNWLTAQLSLPGPTSDEDAYWIVPEDKGAKSGKKKPFKEVLYRHAIHSANEFWQSDNHQCFASLDNRVIDLESENGDHWLRELADDLGKVPSGGEIRDVRKQLSVRSRRGATYKVFVRIAGDRPKGEIYIDVGDEDRNIVIIDKTGWRISKECPVRFFRPPNMLPLPLPDKDAVCDLAVLRDYINLGTDEDYHLLLAWMFGALNPFVHYAHLNLNGEQGTGKSTATTLLRMIVDPTNQPLKSPPKKEDDIVISAINQHVLSIDNLSFMLGDISDALCRLSTGGSFGKRKLYSDTQEVSVTFRKPAIVNGIGNLPNRQDLLDRIFVVTMNRIEIRKSPLALMDHFEAQLPGILATIYKAMSDALTIKIEVEETEDVRLQDLYEWTLKCFSALGIPRENLSRAILRNEKQRLTDSIESDIVAKDMLSLVIHALHSHKRGHCFYDVQPLDEGSKWPVRIAMGSATEILTDINTLHYDRDPEESGVPLNPRALAQKLNRVRPGLVNFGLTFEVRREGPNRIKVYYVIVSDAIKTVPGDWVRENSNHKASDGFGNTAKPFMRDADDSDDEEEPF